MYWHSESSVGVFFVFPFLNIFSGQTMGSDITEFFPEVVGNLTKVTWAHAVNSRKLLADALNSTIMMLEADIVLGTLIGDPGQEPFPIMGHPPAVISDISLEQFLLEILNFNNNQKIPTNKKGVKLDFKTIEVFEMSVPIVKKLYNQMTYPVWINADIIEGPINSTNIPVDPGRFFTGSKHFERSTLSVGWTTRYSVVTGPGSYSEEQVNSIIKAIKDNNIQNDITFPVRAGLAANSLATMELLTESVKNSTLTIWSSLPDPVEVEKLREVIFKIGLNRVFIDVPEKLMKKLRLDQPPQEGEGRELDEVVVDETRSYLL